MTTLHQQIDFAKWRAAPSVQTNIALKPVNPRVRFSASANFLCNASVIYCWFAHRAQDNAIHFIVLLIYICLFRFVRFGPSDKFAFAANQTKLNFLNCITYARRLQERLKLGMNIIMPFCAIFFSAFNHHNQLSLGASPILKLAVIQPLPRCNVSCSLVNSRQPHIVCPHITQPSD